MDEMYPHLTKFIDAEGNVPLHHYSPYLSGDTATVDPNHFGKHSFAKADARVSRMPRSFFYVNPEEKEQHIISGKHYSTKVPATDIYDLRADPHELVSPDIGWTLGEVKSRGFKGVYYNTGNMGVVNMFHPMTVHAHQEPAKLSRLRVFKSDHGQYRWETDNGQSGYTKTRDLAIQRATSALAPTALMISPSTREGSTKAYPTGAQMNLLRRVVKKLEPSATPTHGVGYWKDGKEESLLVHGIPHANIHKTAARLGDKFNQKGVIYFTPNPQTGNGFYHVMTATPEQLDARGVEYKTITGDKAHVLDHDGSLKERLADLKPLSFRGDVHFVGGDTRDQARQEYKKALLSARVSRHEEDGDIHLDGIEVLKRNRGKGHATAALKRLTEHADETGKRIRLMVDSYDKTGLDDNALKQWYGRHGFVPEDQHGYNMVRHPQQPIAKLAAYKAPANGAIVNNQFFPGGRFLPKILQKIRDVRARGKVKQPEPETEEPETKADLMGDLHALAEKHGKKLHISFNARQHDKAQIQADHIEKLKTLARVIKAGAEPQTLHDLVLKGAGYHDDVSHKAMEEYLEDYRNRGDKKLALTIHPVSKKVVAVPGIAQGELATKNNFLALGHPGSAQKEASVYHGPGGMYVTYKSIALPGTYTVWAHHPDFTRTIAAREYSPESAKQHAQKLAFPENPIAKLAKQPFETHGVLSPEDLATGNSKASQKSYTTLLEHSLENRPKSVLPTLDEIKALAQAGQSVKGQYAHAHKVLQDFIGPENARLWVAANAILSPLAKWEHHSRAALRLVRLWRDAGSPTDPESVHEVVRKIGPGETDSEVDALGKKIYPSVGFYSTKMPQLKRLLSDPSFQERIENVSSTGRGKIVEFGKAFTDPLGVPVDTHMAKAITPTTGAVTEKLLKDYRPALKEMIKTSGSAHRLAASISESGDKHLSSALLEAQKKLVSNDAVQKAYKVAIAHGAKQLGWEPREVQETLWSAVVATIAAKNHGIPHDKILTHLRHENAFQAWNVGQLLTTPEMLDDAERLSNRPSEDFRKQADRPPAITGEIKPDSPTTFEGVAARIPAGRTKGAWDGVEKSLSDAPPT